MATFTAPGQLSNAQAGNGDSQNTILDIDVSRPSAVRIVPTLGATPTVTVNILGSIDGVNFFNIPYALVTAPSTWILTAITITTAGARFYLLQANQAWVYVKLVMSANTNVTISADYY